MKAVVGMGKTLLVCTYGPTSRRSHMLTSPPATEAERASRCARLSFLDRRAAPQFSFIKAFKLHLELRSSYLVLVAITDVTTLL